MARNLPPPKLQFFDAAGIPLYGGKVYTYLSGTTTPAPTYTDHTESTMLPNPIILDSRGEAAVWFSSVIAYTVVLKTATDGLIWTADYIGGLPSEVPTITPAQRFSGNDVTVAFTLATTPSNLDATTVHINGVYQQKDTYTLLGDVITFNTAPLSGTNNIEVQAYNTVDAATVIVAASDATASAVAAAASASDASDSAIASDASALAAGSSAVAAAASVVDAADASRLTIGTVTTVAPATPAAATITGLAGAQELSLDIPQGVQGDQGIQGIPGLDGIGAALIVTSVVGTTQAVVVGHVYILNNVAATNVTIPAVFAVGDQFMVAQNNGLTTNTVDFGTNTVRGPAAVGTGLITLDLGAPMWVIAISTTEWVMI